MQSSFLTLLFAVTLLATLMVRYWLAMRQMRHVAAHRSSVPAAFSHTISLPVHQKAADYTLAKNRFALLAAAYSTVILIGWTLFGGLNELNVALRDSVVPRWGDMAYQLSLLAAFTTLASLLDQPLELYRTFCIEERFGFNRVTWKIYLADMFKGAAIGALFGLPIAALILWIMGEAGALWWLWSWGAWTAINLLVLMIYPTLIAPIFNKFEPLANDSLKVRVQALMTRCGFKVKGLFVMNGSKRSAHANAYFTGIGSSKRVVFYDTLLAKLTPQEVEAVLAHELGHFKHKHVTKRMVMMFGLSLAGFALLGWVAEQTWFYTAFAIEPSLAVSNDAVALLLILMVAPVFSFFISPLFAQLSRKHEFQADAFACTQASGNDLASALLKLHEDNASTLTPDPLYVRFYYSHPAASERLAALNLKPANP